MRTLASCLLGLAAVLLTGSLLVHRLIGRRKARIAWAAAALLLGGICFGWVGLKAARKGYHRGTHAVARVRQRLAPRTGQELYAAQFGPPLPNCLTVQNYQDQVVPRLDCCIWLEFSCCPAELRRMLARGASYRAATPAAADSLTYSPRPAWWTPARLGPARRVRRNFAATNPNRDQLLVFSADSTHAYYCDMAD